MLSASIRLLISLLGGLMAFALWLVAVLLCMPRPPVPPSFAVTLIAPIVAALGFGLGMRGAEHLTKLRPRSSFCEAYRWSLGGAALGTMAMFPLGGMMAGFGLFGAAMAALLIREALHLRRTAAAKKRA
jgi:hypothetical protein